MATLLETVRARIRERGAESTLMVDVQRGAGPMGWDPADPDEVASAECVIVTGPDCFGALCALGGRYRFFTGNNDDEPLSQEFPSGETDTLDAALSEVISTASSRLVFPPGK